jgi:hypothetical protein
MSHPARCGRSLLIALALALGLGGGVGGAAMRGGGGGGHRGGAFRGHPGWHGGGWRGRHGGGPHVFIDGGFFFGAPFYWGDPFLYGPDYYYYPYPPAYAYPYDYPPPPPEGSTAEAAPPEREEGGSEPQASGQASRASYGLVQLRGVGDGASVDLDGRFWLTADHLDDRWLGLPEGTHTITVRVGDAPSETRQVDVRAGRTRVVDFGSRG